MPIRNRNHAFTLMELVIVLAIVLLLAGMAAPRYAQWTARYRADLAAQQIARDMELAQAMARSGSQDQLVVFLPAQDRYILADSVAAATAGHGKVVQLYHPPFEARLDSASFGGRTYLVYNGYGEPTETGAAKLHVGSQVRTIRVQPSTGKAVIE